MEPLAGIEPASDGLRCVTALRAKRANLHKRPATTAQNSGSGFFRRLREDASRRRAGRLFQNSESSLLLQPQQKKRQPPRPAKLPANLERATRELKILSLVAATLAYIMVLFESPDKTASCSAAKQYRRLAAGRHRLCSSKMKSKPLVASANWYTEIHTCCR